MARAGTPMDRSLKEGSKALVLMSIAFAAKHREACTAEGRVGSWLM
jgi:hypothetical protein